MAMAVLSVCSGMDSACSRRIFCTQNVVSQADIDTLVEEYYDKYEILLEGRDEKEFREHVAVQAGIEIGFERSLEQSGILKQDCRLGGLQS